MCVWRQERLRWEKGCFSLFQVFPSPPHPKPALLGNWNLFPVFRPGPHLQPLRGRDCGALPDSRVLRRLRPRGLRLGLRGDIRPTGQVQVGRSEPQPWGPARARSGGKLWPYLLLRALLGRGRRAESRGRGWSSPLSPEPGAAPPRVPGRPPDTRSGRGAGEARPRAAVITHRGRCPAENSEHRELRRARAGRRPRSPGRRAGHRFVGAKGEAVARPGRGAPGAASAPQPGRRTRRAEKGSERLKPGGGRGVSMRPKRKSIT